MGVAFLLQNIIVVSGIDSPIDIPLCTKGKDGWLAADHLCLGCSSDDDKQQCAPCTQDGCDGYSKYYIQFDEAEPWTMSYLNLTSSTKDKLYDPDQVVIKGSNDDGFSWRKIATKEVSWTNRSSGCDFFFNNNKMFKSYMIEISKLNGTQSMYIGGMSNPKSDSPPTPAPTTPQPTDAPTDSSAPTEAPTTPQPTDAPTEKPTVPCKATFVDNEGNKSDDVVPLVVDANTYVFGVKSDWYKMVAIDKDGKLIERRYMGTNKALTIPNWNAAWSSAAYYVENVQFC